jgi:hypothetical protein
MASKFNLPNLQEGNKMSFKDLVGKRMSKTVKFMGEDVKINKLSVAEVLDIQAKAKSIGENEQEGLSVLKTVISSAVEGASEIADEDFNKFPMDELSKLSNEIMKFSGIGQEAGK